MRKVIRTVVIAIVALIAIMCSLLYIPWGCTSPIESSPGQDEANILRQQKNSILVYLYEAGHDFPDEITLEEHRDEDGNPYYVGILSDELEEILIDLVDAYNADPNTETPITTEEVRYALTDGIVEATKERNWGSAFGQFILWCGELAENVVVYDSDGTELGNPGVSNYEYIRDRQSWANTQQHPGGGTHG